MRRVLVVALVAAVLAWVAWRLQWGREAVAPARGPAVDTLSTGFRAARLYFASRDGDRLVEETRDLPEPGGLREHVAALVAELARGPHGSAVTTLPAGTTVLHVYLDDHGLMTLDLSPEFQQGFQGGSTAEYFALATLVRTLAGGVPEVRRIQIVCGGAPVASLGGHLSLDRPLDVQDW